ncbi:uncharacterized protein ACOB8E_023805 [Sarcophilus harrisii]
MVKPFATSHLGKGLRGKARWGLVLPRPGGPGWLHFKFRAQFLLQLIAGRRLRTLRSPRPERHGMICDAPLGREGAEVRDGNSTAGNASRLLRPARRPPARPPRRRCAQLSPRYNPSSPGAEAPCVTSRRRQLGSPPGAKGGSRGWEGRARGGASCAGAGGRLWAKEGGSQEEGLVFPVSWVTGGGGGIGSPAAAAAAGAQLRFQRQRRRRRRRRRGILPAWGRGARGDGDGGGRRRFGEMEKENNLKNSIGEIGKKNLTNKTAPLKVHLAKCTRK